MNTSLVKGTFLVVVGSIIFGLSPVLIKLAYTTDITPMTLSALSYLLGIIFLTGYFIVLKIPFKISRDYIIKALLLGFLFRGGINLCFFIGFQYISASLGELIFFLYPAITVLIAHFFLKEMINFQKGLAVIISFLGCFLVLYGPMEILNYKGIILMLLAALLNSVYVSYSSVFLKKYPPLVLLYYTAIGAFFTFIAWGIITQSLVFNIAKASWSYIFIIGAGVVCGMLCFLYGISYIGASKAALISTLEPVSTIFTSAIILSERLSLIQIFGAMMVIVSGILSIGKKNKQLSVDDEFQPEQEVIPQSETKIYP